MAFPAGTAETFGWYPGTLTGGHSRMGLSIVQVPVPSRELFLSRSQWVLLTDEPLSWVSPEDRASASSPL